jgi:hypothetical protein
VGGVHLFEEQVKSLRASHWIRIAFPTVFMDRIYGTKASKFRTPFATAGCHPSAYFRKNGRLFLGRAFTILYRSILHSARDGSAVSLKIDRASS